MHVAAAVYNVAARPALQGGPVAGSVYCKGANFLQRIEDSRRWLRGGSRRAQQHRRQSHNGDNPQQTVRPRRLRPSSPNDSPLRVANRDLLMGLLTERATRTLIFYFMELNPTLMQWLEYFVKENPIPREGSWEDVSGDTFLRKLLSMPLEETRWDFYGRDKVFAKSSPLGVDPRQIAQRIMEIRSQIAKEWIEELSLVSEENAILMRETVQSSFVLAGLPVVTPEEATSSTHPELLHPDFLDG